MESNNLVLGIDTSNYTTSAALTDRRGRVIKNIQKPLRVKQGERGLRQSDALFQHVEQLPELLDTLLEDSVRGRIQAVAVSDRPRPVEGSYMPVFLAGLRFGSVAAKCLGVPLFRFSHQEGHLAAAGWGTPLAEAERLLCWHLSGGTCELLLSEGGTFSIVGGSKDISFGQLIDRVGVAMGLSFPCGKAMDAFALEAEQNLKAGQSLRLEREQGRQKRKNPLKPIPADGLFFNVSGIETQAQRLLADSGASAELPFFLFSRMTECIRAVSKSACEAFGIRQVLFTGGVSASGFLRGALAQTCPGLPSPAAAKTEAGVGIEAEIGNFQAVFGEPALSADNAVGISLLGGRQLWH